MIYNNTVIITNHKAMKKTIKLSTLFNQLRKNSKLTENEVNAFMTLIVEWDELQEFKKNLKTKNIGKQQKAIEKVFGIRPPFAFMFNFWESPYEMVQDLKN
jgi:hypothetical protein